MIASNVVDVHKILGYCDEDIVALKKVKLVWQKLETLKAKASKDDAQAVKAYHDLLQKSLAQARLTQPLPDSVDESRRFWEWYEAECDTFGVSALEISRGAPHQAWCEKWRSSEYAEFEAAMARVTGLPSENNFRELRTAAGKMLRAYVEAFKED